MKSSFPEKAFMRIAVSDDKEHLKSYFSTFILPFVCLPVGILLLPKRVRILFRIPFYIYGKTVSELRLYLHSRIY